MRVLITGGSGFIGSNLAAACVRRGDEVRVLRRSKSSLVGLNMLPIEHVVGDLLDAEAVMRAVAGCDLVFHVAAISSYWRSKRAEIYRVNAEGTRVVMEACLKAGVLRVVHTSSAAAVGIAQNGCADESTPFDAVSSSFAYADSKHKAEAVVRAAVERGLQAVMVNPAIVIGAGDHYLNSSSMVLEYGRGRVPVMPPGGACVADIDAVVQGHLVAAEHGRIGERYILGGENLTYRQITATIAQVTGVRPPPVVVPKAILGIAAPVVDMFNTISRRPPLISGEQVRLSQLNFFFDSGKAVRELDYPIMPFRGAVEKAYAWYREHGYMS